MTRDSVVPHDADAPPHARSARSALFSFSRAARERIVPQAPPALRALPSFFRRTGIPARRSPHRARCGRSLRAPLLAAAALLVAASVPDPVALRAADQVSRPAADAPVPRIAVLASVYFHNSHADVIATRMLRGLHLDGRPPYPKLRFASLYVDQFPANDKSRALMKEHGVPIFATPEEALTLGTGKLAVDGILLIAEHGNYPVSPLGQVRFPKRRLFEAVVRVCEKSGRAVPVFVDKHLADTWDDAKWIHDAAARLKMPLMAGSSLPILWRHPPADVTKGAVLKDLLCVSYHTLDGYGFHGLEMLQGLAERRKGGETGIRRVECLSGQAVWEAGDRGLYDPKLLAEALARLERQPLRPGVDLRTRVKSPHLFVIDYVDGLRAFLVCLDDPVVEWTATWREGTAPAIRSTNFWTQEDRPFDHFAFLLQGIEKMMHTGRPTWPSERTLMTSGLLDALLQSKSLGKPVDTPHLRFAYELGPDWTAPPPPSPPRDIRFE